MERKLLNLLLKQDFWSTWQSSYLKMPDNSTFNRLASPVVLAFALIFGTVSFNANAQCSGISAPFMEDFDSLALTSPYRALPSCWVAQTGPDYWDVTNGSTNSAAYLSGFVDHTTGSGNYMWIDASSDITVNEMVTPDINISGLTLPLAGFWFGSNNVTNAVNHTINLDVWDGTAWVTLLTYAANFDGWKRIYAIIPPAIPTTTYFRMVQVGSTVGGSQYYNDLLIDDFFVEEGPPCIAPSLLTSSAVTATSVDLSWAPGGGIFYMMEYGLPGFVPGTGAELGSTSGTNTLESITGLSPASGYEFYVTAICPTGDTLSPIGPISFITAYSGVLCRLLSSAFSIKIIVIRGGINYECTAS